MTFRSCASTNSMGPIDEVNESQEVTHSIPRVTVEKEKISPAKALQRIVKHRSVPTFFSANHIAPSSNFQENRATSSLPVYQRAEIQLKALMDEPEASLPVFTRRVSESFSESRLSIEKVSKLLNTPTFIVVRLINALNCKTGKENETETLSKSQVQTITRALNGTFDVRALIFFKMFDTNHDEFISKDDLEQFYDEYFKTLKTFDPESTKEFIQVLLEKFQLDQKSKIDFEEFYSIVLREQYLLESFSQFSVNPTWFIENTTHKQKKNLAQRFFSRLCIANRFNNDLKNKLTKDYFENNLSRIVFLILYILINLALMLYVIIYRSVTTHAHVFVVIARTAGMLLNFNCAFIVVLMLKQTILHIRTNKFLRKILPVDDHIDFHRIVGRFIAVLTVIHAIGHMCNFARLDEHSWFVYMFTTRPNVGWIDGFAPLSGIILTLILTVMVVCSMQWIRRSGRFQVFYWTHLLYFPFFVFLILHAKNFWKWGIGPLSIFVLEKVYSLLTRYSTRSGRTYLQSATIEQSNVISLKIHRPKNFTFQPGDYITINLPRVALYEFHPFTISSAPEDLEFLTVHVQAVGNWTKQVYQRFKTMSESNDENATVQVYRADLNRRRSRTENQDSDLFENNFETKQNIVKREPIVVNGPYSSCARYVFDCKHVILIGGGIGVTPYASVLSSLMAQFRSSRFACKHCHGINYLSKGLCDNHRLIKLDFIWVNRDQKNFEWFLKLLRQFEQEQDTFLRCYPDEQRFLDIHLYFTEIKHDQNIANAPLDLVSRIWAQVAGGDMFTSLKSKTHIGRPNWDKVFQQIISSDSPSIGNDVNVFFCGPKTMGKTIREHSLKYRFRYYEENF